MDVVKMVIIINFTIRNVAIIIMDKIMKFMVIIKYAFIIINNWNVIISLEQTNQTQIFNSIFKWYSFVY